MTAAAESHGSAQRIRSVPHADLLSVWRPVPILLSLPSRHIRVNCQCSDRLTAGRPSVRRAARARSGRLRRWRRAADGARARTRRPRHRPSPAAPTPRRSCRTVRTPCSAASTAAARRRLGHVGQDDRVATEDVVAAVVRRALVEQPRDRMPLPALDAGIRHLRRPAGRSRHQPPSSARSSATHSTCAVIGNRSNARSAASRNPCPANSDTSRASDDGSQATCTTRRGAAAAMPSTTARPAPLRGGSSTTTSAVGRDRASHRSTRPVTTVTFSQSARLLRAAAAAAPTLSTATTRPVGTCGSERRRRTDRPRHTGPGTRPTARTSA